MSRHDAIRKFWRELVPWALLAVTLTTLACNAATPQVDSATPTRQSAPVIIANRTITILAAPIESYKSIYAMHISHALLTGKPAFEHFPVAAQVSKVIYCVPDMSFELALRYARDIGLDRKGINFHIRTMKQGELLGMDSNAPK